MRKRQLYNWRVIKLLKLGWSNKTIKQRTGAGRKVIAWNRGLLFWQRKYSDVERFAKYILIPAGLAYWLLLTTGIIR